MPSRARSRCQRLPDEGSHQRSPCLPRPRRRRFRGAEGDELDYPTSPCPSPGRLRQEKWNRAVLICGTGLGMAIVANKVPGVAPPPPSPTLFGRARHQSNNAQVLCLGAKVVGVEVAELLLDHWMGSDFAGGASARKVAKIEAMDAVRAEVRP